MLKNTLSHLKNSSVEFKIDEFVLSASSFRNQVTKGQV